jgi:hypothetical protein
LERSSKAQRRNPRHSRTTAFAAPTVSPRLAIPLLVFALVAAPVVWLIFRSSTRLTLEDALIIYRYAENLALGVKSKHVAHAGL